MIILYRSPLVSHDGGDRKLSVPLSTGPCVPSSAGLSVPPSTGPTVPLSAGPSTPTAGSSVAPSAGPTVPLSAGPSVPLSAGPSVLLSAGPSMPSGSCPFVPAHSVSSHLYADYARLSSLLGLSSCSSTHRRGDPTTWFNPQSNFFLYGSAQPKHFCCWYSINN